MRGRVTEKGEAVRGPAALAADRQGASAVEFALVAPTLVLLLLGILEFSLLMAAEVTLSNAVAEVARFGITGQTGTDKTREELIREQVDQAAEGLFDSSLLEFETLVYPDFSSVGRPEPFNDENGNGVRDPGESYEDLNGNGQWDADMGVPGAGGPDDIVLYRVRYPWRLMIPVFRPFFPPDGEVEIEASLAVRNEPFPEE